MYTTKEYHHVGGEQAWNNILDEYSSMLKTENSDKQFDLYKRIAYNQWRLKIVEIVMSDGGLRDMWRPKLADSLVEAGFDYVQNIEDDKKYQRQLDIVMNEASSIVVKLNQLYIQYNALLPKGEHKEHKEKKEIDFDKELMVLAKQGYRINKRRQSITEYCAAVNALFDEVERHKKNINNKNK